MPAAGGDGPAVQQGVGVPDALQPYMGGLKVIEPVR